MSESNLGALPDAGSTTCARRTTSRSSGRSYTYARMNRASNRRSSGQAARGLNGVARDVHANGRRPARPRKGGESEVTLQVQKRLAPPHSVPTQLGSVILGLIPTGPYGFFLLFSRSYDQYGGADGI